MSRQLSPGLAKTLKRFAEAPVSYSDEHECMVVAGIGRVPGLTRVLGRLVPVPVMGHDDVAEQPRKRARKSRLDPEPQPEVWSYVKAGKGANRLRSQAVKTCKDSTSRCSIARLDEASGRSGIGQAYNMRHGILVDEQITLCVERGSTGMFGMLGSGVMRGGLDPCTATMLDYLRDKGLVAIASQVPLFSVAMGVATRIDIFATDIATRTELHLIEQKVTTAATPEAVKRGDVLYEKPRARLKRSALRGFPLSPYTSHQLQLFAMVEMINEFTGAPPTTACVLRVSPGVVRRYALNEYYKSRAVKIIGSISKSTGQKRRLAKKKRNLSGGLKSALKKK